MEFWQAAQWTLRIVLPIILFILWSKFQSGNEGPSGYPGPTKNVCSRGKILSRRKLVDPEDKPQTLANLCMKSQEQAPELFVNGSRPGRGGGGGGGRDRERKPRGDRDREQGGEQGGGQGEKREKREKREKKIEKENDEESKSEAAAAPVPSTSEKKMNLESLLNYVAFNRRPHRRVLLPEEGVSPPPPPKRLRPGAVPDGGAEISGAAAEQANAEAQMVLRGAAAFKTATVAKDLYEHLMDKQVEITERTFTLMIEGCVLAGDLKSASDFLMKMETSGFCPESDLLDKVMDLYSQQKSQRQKQAEAPKEPTPMGAAPSPLGAGAPAFAPGGGGEAAEGDAEKLAEDDLAKSSSLRSRLKLSSDAPVFVPSFMPAPPAPPAADAPAGERPEEGEGRTSLRTRLVASAKPFEPLFNVTFDPAMYTWTADKTEEGGGGGKSGGKGEELGEGGKKGKTGDGKEGKGKGKDGKSGGKEGKGKDGKDGKSGGKAKKGAESSKDEAAEKDGPRWKPKE